MTFEKLMYLSDFSGAQINLEKSDITENSRDYDVQQHKSEIYQEFEKRLSQAFPEGFKIDSMEFGLDKEH